MARAPTPGESEGQRRGEATPEPLARHQDRAADPSRQNESSTMSSVKRKIGLIEVGKIGLSLVRIAFDLYRIFHP